MPSGHEIIINSGDSSWWPPGCLASRRMPRSAKRIGSIVWCSSQPGLSWPEAYYITSNRARDHWILWGEADPGDYGILVTRVPLAWRPRFNMTFDSAARTLLHAYWHSHAETGREIFEDAGSGLLSEAELWTMGYEVWPNDQPMDTGTIYCDVSCNALHIHLVHCRCYIWANGLIAEIERPTGQPVRLTCLTRHVGVNGQRCIGATDQLSQSWCLTVRP